MNKDTLYIVDLDRTLIDVEEVMRIAGSACESLGIDFNKIDKKYKELAAKEIPYSPLEDIAKYSRPEEFKKRFIELSQNDKLLFSDSRKFLDWLEINNDYMILTYGADNSWQILKLQASGLSKKPYLIIKDRYKGRLIKSWTSEGKTDPEIDGLGAYKQCVLIDDRPAAFEDIPSNCSGYLIDRKRKLSGITLGGNAKVRIIKSLSMI